MATVTIGSPRLLQTSNVALYWGLAITAAILLALFFMRAPREITAPASNKAVAQNMMIETNPALRQIDPATGRAYQVDPVTGTIIDNPYNPAHEAQIVNTSTKRKNNSRVRAAGQDPRAEDFHNGANSVNGGIAPNTPSK